MTDDGFSAASRLYSPLRSPGSTSFASGFTRRVLRF